MNLLFSNPEAASPAPPFTANCEPTLDEILEEPIIRQLMASDGVTEATLRRLASEMGESLIATRVDRAEVPFYSDHLLSALQSTLASLADVDVRYEIERDYLEEWRGPDEVKRRLMAALEAGWRRGREPIVGRLTRLQNQMRAPVPAYRPESVRHEGGVGSNENGAARRSAG
jgi:hypothetical protein